MQIEGEVFISAPAEAVFDFFADIARLPEWAAEDFVSAARQGSDPIGPGTRFSYVTKGARVESWFEWERFERPRVLVWTGPRVNVGPGWVEGRGEYVLDAVPEGIRLRATLEPKLGGLLRLFTPMVKIRNTVVLARQLKRAKGIIERSAVAG